MPRAVLGKAAIVAVPAVWLTAMLTTARLILVTQVVLCLAGAVAQELLLVHAVWRHGHRTPTSFIPTDIKNNGPNTWPYGVGELTKLGMTQHFILGKMIADRYVRQYPILNLNYSSNMLYIHSDDFNRTLVSSYSNMAGFFINSTYYNPTGFENWPHYWNPIPIHTFNKFNDTMLWLTAPCPMAEEVLNKEVKTLKNYTEIMVNNSRFFQRINNKTHFVPPVDLSSLWKVYDPICIEREGDEMDWPKDAHQPPSWVTPELYAQLADLYHKATEYLYHAPKLTQLRAGQLVQAINNRMLVKVDSMTQPPSSKMQWIQKLKFFGYSAHDLTLVAYLEALGSLQSTTGGKMPGYASCVLVELWKNASQHYVKLFYRKGPSGTNFRPMKVRGCPDPSMSISGCPLDQFINTLKPFYVANWRQACGLDASSATQASLGMTILFIVTGLFRNYLLN